jgi:hypothetical protein
MHLLLFFRNKNCFQGNTNNSRHSITHKTENLAPRSTFFYQIMIKKNVLIFQCLTIYVSLIWDYGVYAVAILLV